MKIWWIPLNPSTVKPLESYSKLFSLRLSSHWRYSYHGLLIVRLPPSPSIGPILILYQMLHWKWSFTCRLVDTLHILFLFLRQSLMYPRLASNFLCSRGGSWLSDAPDCTSQVIGLQTWATTPSLYNPGICISYANRSINWAMLLALFDHLLNGSFLMIFFVASTVFGMW